MKNIFQETKINVINRISKSSNGELFSEDFQEKLYQGFKIDTPLLDTKNTNVSIQEEVITSRNAPFGIMYSPGQSMEVAYIVVPIVGNLELFAALAKHLFYNRQTKYVEGRKLIYREYSPEKITGNDKIINGIKERAKNEIDAIQNELDKFKKIADDFNDNELKETITICIKQEQDRRNQKSSSENKLNPFG